MRSHGITKFYMAEMLSVQSRYTKTHITPSSARIGKDRSLCGRVVYPTGTPVEELWSDDACTFTGFCITCLNIWDLQTNERCGTILS